MELRVTELTKEFQDVKAVDHVNLTMNYGVYGLLGVNGAGKTTFMRMLCTLIRPTAGMIACNGKDIFELDGEYRKILGYLPQEFGFYPDFTVQDYLMYISSIKGVRPAVARKRMAELLRRVGLTKAKNKKMKKLSGGMKRRVGIAQAMLNDPEILILDEPTAGLDPNERIRFRNLISDLAQDRLVLLSTHIVSDIEHIANEILLMKDGRIVHSGTQEEILAEVPTKVWSVVVSRNEVETWQKTFKVANMKTVPQGTELRVLSTDRPGLSAREEAMTLEDVFLYYFGEKAGAEDGIL
ncbi:MAG: ABC transporter ATP-binding protein [Lachnospiraceae bacterium]|nr:ABC transporter ATP-binding protein [Lachnospiraceae bacterium]